ncbi:MAG: hypothetical protein EOP06_27465, partial [Proteobacteria bacterium]
MKKQNLIISFALSFLESYHSTASAAGAGGSQTASIRGPLGDPISLARCAPISFISIAHSEALSVKPSAGAEVQFWLDAKCEQPLGAGSVNLEVNQSMVTVYFNHSSGKTLWTEAGSYHCWFATSNWAASGETMVLGPITEGTCYKPMPAHWPKFSIGFS